MGPSSALALQTPFGCDRLDGDEKYTEPQHVGPSAAAGRQAAHAARAASSSATAMIPVVA